MRDSPEADHTGAMIAFAQGLGFLLSLTGLFGAADHLWGVRLFGILGVVNRQVIEPLSVFDGWEVVANLGVAALGVLIMVIASRFAGQPDT